MDKRYRKRNFPIRLIKRRFPSYPPHHASALGCTGDARHDANSPHASGLDARFAWRAEPSFRLRRAVRLLNRKFTRRRLRWRSTKEERHCAAGLRSNLTGQPFGFRWTLHVFFFGRAPAYAVSDDGSRAQPCPRGRGQRLCRR